MIRVRQQATGRTARRIAETSVFLTRTAAGLGLSLALLASAGCGNNYRPVVSSIGLVGPAGQPTKYAVAISNPGAGAAGLVTVVDVSGDTVLVTPNIGVNPQYLALNSGGSTAYILNGDGTINSFGISTYLQTRNVLQTTLLSGANPVSLFPSGAYTYIAEAGRNALAELTGTPPGLQQEIATGTTPTYTVGIPSAPRIYSLVQAPPAGTVCPSGAATGIDAATNTITSVLCTGANPVYGVMSADARRAFVLNKASGTVTVINAQTNQLDTFLNSSNQVSNTIPVGTNPVWADFAPTLNELFVLNAGNGTTPGTVNIISIPLCSQTAQVNNPNCDSSNPEDAVGFGTILATIPVGINPTVIGVLQDGTQAYVANAGNTATGVQGSVSVINLQTDTVVATIAASNASTVSLSDTLVHGNPGFLAVTTGTPTGKVYVTSPNSKDLTIIRTDIDQVSSHVTLQGLGVMVRVTQP